MLWRALRNHQIDRRGFRRQTPIGPYCADFVCLARMLVVDPRTTIRGDGRTHETADARIKDAERDEWFRHAGCRVLRFPTSSSSADCRSSSSAFARRCGRMRRPWLGLDVTPAKGACCGVSGPRFRGGDNLERRRPLPALLRHPSSAPRFVSRILVEKLIGADRVGGSPLDPFPLAEPAQRAPPPPAPMVRLGCHPRESGGPVRRRRRLIAERLGCDT
jgi:very-short-patch-repair endonuclease